MVHDSVLSCIGTTPLVRLGRLFPSSGHPVIAKLELLNPGGSVKDRPAHFIVEQGLRSGALTHRSHLVESTSGNLGIALAMAARVHGLPFTCVVDPNIAPANLRLLECLGARVEMVLEQDECGGYLGTRVRRVQELLHSLPDAVWINQYANARNWRAHYHLTAREILADLDGPVDVLVLGISTSGTILGLARRLRLVFPCLRVIAVDAAGSVIFGGHSGPRRIPGLGASRVPELFSPDEIDDVVVVSDREAASGCRSLLAAEGIFAGGSSGAVVAGIEKLIPRLSGPARILTLLADRGERYLDLVYDDEWVAALPEVGFDDASVADRAVLAGASTA
ncbi:MAG: 2,3-diaminopropionate biosynthesis protein SbnA [Actinobacteria bacterium]|nr:2,3-diaminopropionate biosynthesis protein SbnA [Actinomycetota bacterium]